MRNIEKQRKKGEDMKSSRMGEEHVKVGLVMSKINFWMAARGEESKARY